MFPKTMSVILSTATGILTVSHSTLAPWHGQRGKPHVATADVGGWPDNVWGPSAIPFSHTYPEVKEMTKDQINETVEAFGTAAKRAVEAGFDVIEIHGAHGYLITVTHIATAPPLHIPFLTAIDTNVFLRAGFHVTSKQCESLASFTASIQSIS